MEIFQVVQTIPRRLIDAGALMEACFKRRNGFGHLSQETIDARRAERRGYAEEMARVAKGEGMLVQRKHTIFSRRKALDRSPLQRVELTLDIITKEEKRAWVEKAEHLAREASTIREPEKSSVPQREPSFRERAAPSRSTSNKLKKDPPGDPWFSQHLETEKTYPEVSPRRLSVDARRNPDTMAGTPLGSAPVAVPFGKVPENMRDEGSKTRIEPRPGLFSNNPRLIQSLSFSPEGTPEEGLENSYHSSETTDETTITTPDSPETDNVNDLDSLLEDDLESVLSEYKGEERIRNPTAYFQKLADLEAEVYHRSRV